MVRCLLFAVLVFAASVSPVRAQQVFINEILASNAAALEDPDFDAHSDWIELRNATDREVDLSGSFLTDDLDEPQKWTIPSGTTIGAGGFLLVWADGEDARPPTTAALHASFKLSVGGEAVALFDASGTLVDSVSFGEQTTDVSYGRLASRPETWAFFGEPTPGAANTTTPGGGVLDVPAASHGSGFYARGTTVTFRVQPGEVVRLTRDGSLPTASSPELSGPLVLSETAVIRAAAFAEGQVPSGVVTRTYFVDEEAAGYASRLPVISLVAEPDDFFGDERGIYVEGTSGVRGPCREAPANWWQKNWERPVHLTLFEPDGAGGFEAALDHGAGAKIFGGCSRNYPQKSLSLHARGRYGASKFEHAIFPDRDLSEYDDLVLRNSGNDWVLSMMRGGLIETLTRPLDLDGRAYRPAVVFLNGAFFGLHNLREKLNEDYLASHYGIEKSAVRVLEPRAESHLMADAHYAELAKLLETAWVNAPGVYEQVDAMMDIDQFIAYQIVEIYIGNKDWPSNNTKLWRPRTDGGRWRWMLYDTDYGFGGFHGASYDMLAHATEVNGPAWPNPPWATFLLRTLLQHKDFRHTFIQRFAAHMATTFEPERTIAVIDSLAARIAPVMPRHQKRWPESASLNGDWAYQLDVLRDFVRVRPDIVRFHVEDYFGDLGTKLVPLFDDVTGTQPLTLGAQDGGHVLLAEVPMTGADNAGGLAVVLFQGVPARVEAIADEGYVFTGWQGTAAPSDSESAAFELDLTAPADLRATFARGTAAERTPAEAAVALGAPYPNPATLHSAVTITLPEAAAVSLHVYDLLGRRVQVLAEGVKLPGTHAVPIRADALASGVYVVVLRASGCTATRRFVVAG